MKGNKYKVSWNRGTALNIPAGTRVPVCGEMSAIKGEDRSLQSGEKMSELVAVL